MSDAPSRITFGADTLSRSPTMLAGGAATVAPQAAVRARLNAVILDLLLLGLISQVLVSSFSRGGGAPSELSRSLWFLAIQFAYFFLLELGGGQTIGKRIFKVRVTSSRGGTPSVGQIALRNLLRPIDAVPFLYASGLISMIRTGPSRRQRIGDVAGGTLVVLDSNARPLRTPGWLLPALTVFAASVSILVILAIANGAPRSDVSNGAGAEPVAAVWTAHSTHVRFSGYGARPASVALWTIGRDCTIRDGAGPCRVTLRLRTPGGLLATAPLLPERGAWMAVFPIQTLPCGRRGAGATWRQRTAVALRFLEGGRRAIGEQHDYAYSPACGAAQILRSWTAEAGPGA